MRLLESAHISGYSFERVCAELEWLLEEEHWKQVGLGYEHINDFLQTIDLSPFNLSSEQHRPLAKGQALGEQNAALVKAADPLPVETFVTIVIDPLGTGAMRGMKTSLDVRGPPSSASSSHYRRVGTVVCP